MIRDIDWEIDRDMNRYDGILDIEYRYRHRYFDGLEG